MNGGWKKTRCALRNMHLTDKCLLVFMLILLAQTAHNLFFHELAQQESSAFDVIVRTTMAAIFGYLISANFQDSGKTRPEDRPGAGDKSPAGVTEAVAASHASTAANPAANAGAGTGEGAGANPGEDTGAGTGKSAWANPGEGAAANPEANTGANPGTGARALATMDFCGARAQGVRIGFASGAESTHRQGGATDSGSPEMPGSAAAERPESPAKGTSEMPGNAARGSFEMPGSGARGSFEMPGKVAGEKPEMPGSGAGEGEEKRVQLQILVVAAIGILALLLLMIAHNHFVRNDAATATISQLRDFVSGSVGFLIGHSTHQK
ncbi:MAG: hypothetical protein RR296_07995 [Clostridia bacterium]